MESLPRSRASRPLPSLALFCACAMLGACGGTTKVVKGGPVINIQPETPAAAQNAERKLGFPTLATKNTTRVDGADPVADAAAVALAVYPSAAPGTHPGAVAIAPTDDWQAAIAAASLMAAPIRAPILLSGSSSLPPATLGTLGVLAPTGSAAAGGAQVIRIGNVPSTGGRRTVSIAGTNPYALAASIDRFASAARGGRPGVNVVVASADNAASAMPAAGWAAESGEPVLFVSGSRIPGPTRQALISHQHPHIYVLGAPSVISAGVVKQLRKFGSVKRIGGIGGSSTSDPAANSVAFAEYRDPPCATGQACVHVPGSFGWAVRSPGHGYVLLNAHRPLDAAAAAPLSASSDYGPQLLVNDASKLPPSVLNFFLNYATPGYTREGPTAAVYNHGWVIGNVSAISLAVQAEMDMRLEVVPEQTPK